MAERRTAGIGSSPIEAAPIVAGVALIACGALVTRLRPHLLALPKPGAGKPSATGRYRAGDRVGAVAQKGRDTILDVMPPNLLTWLGRMLMLAGAAVVITRLLDRLVDDEDMKA